MVDLIIIGAGFAGLVAAISAARKGLDVLVLEHMDSAGRKLKMTGNGKCNLAPERIFQNSYHSSYPVATTFPDLSISDELSFFRDLGLDPICKKGGYYPGCERGSAVLDALLFECNRLGVDIEYNVAIRGVCKADRFTIDTKQGEYFSKYVLLATGGKTYKNTGSDGSGHIYAKKLGHNIVEMKPVLCGLNSKVSKKYELAGIRVKSILTLYINGTKIASEAGELQLTEYGISGICVFNLSSYVTSLDLDKNSVSIAADFLPDKIGGYMYLRMKELRDSVYSATKSIVEALSGIIHDRLVFAACEDLGFDSDRSIGSLSDYELEQLILKLKAFYFTIDGFKGFDSAQCTAGGVDFAEVDINTLQSKIVPGLCFAGEVLDINGNCGGYNLLWAYYSATKAVKSIVNND